MNVRSLAFAAIALIAVSAAFAEAPKAKAADPRPVAREQSLLEEVAMGMREIVRAVTPEISLPKVELKLPKLDANAL